MRARAVQPGVDRCAHRSSRRRCAVHPDEPSAANVLRIGTLICAAASPAHCRAAARDGYDVCPVDVSELAKAEAGVTCCSLIVELKLRAARFLVSSNLQATPSDLTEWRAECLPT